MQTVIPIVYDFFVYLGNQLCYNENGQNYRGTVHRTISGRKCLPWSIGYNTIHYDELIGGHNYCRNPDGVEAQPWCLIDDDSRAREICDILRCGKLPRIDQRVNIVHLPGE